MSSIMDEYMNQTTSWVALTSHDEYGQQQKAAAVTVPCRWEGNRKMVTNAQGEQVMSTGQVFVSGELLHPVLKREPEPGDFFNDGTRDWQAIAVAGMPDLEGATAYYQVYL